MPGDVSRLAMAARLSAVVLRITQKLGIPDDTDSKWFLASTLQRIV